MLCVAGYCHRWYGAVFRVTVFECDHAPVGSVRAATASVSAALVRRMLLARIHEGYVANCRDCGRRRAAKVPIAANNVAGFFIDVLPKGTRSAPA